MSISGKTKRWVAAGVAVLAIGGGSGLALAQQGGSAQAPNAPSIADTSAPGAAEQAETPNAPETGERSEAADDAGEKAESAKLAPLAKVDRAQAEQAALAKVPGTVSDAQLGDENGDVIWEIDVTGADGAQHEVKVDAGSGIVIAAALDD